MLPPSSITNILFIQRLPVFFLVIFRTNNSLPIKIMLLFLGKNTEFLLCNVGSNLSHKSYIKCVFQRASRRRGADRHAALETINTSKNIN